MDGVELAALYTVQHGLAGDVEKTHGLVHTEVALRGVVDETGAQLVVQSNAPRRSGRQLLAADEAVVEQAMDGRGGDAETSSAAPFSTTSRPRFLCGLTHSARR